MRMTKQKRIEDLDKRIRTITEMKSIVHEKLGKVSVSYDTEIAVMLDYCDYLIEELEKSKQRME